MRVAIAEDSALFRAGLAALLRSAGIEVAASAATGSELERLLPERPVDVVIVDVRMPPTYTDEGIATALRLRASHPGLAVLVLSTYAEIEHAVRLLSAGTRGVGYLLKDRVDDLTALTEALARLVAGESVLDPEVVAGLLRRPRASGPVDALTDRERRVLELMAEGRSNAGIAAALYLSAKTVETHVAAVFGKLGLAAAATDNRRVLAVLAHLAANTR